MALADCAFSGTLLEMSPNAAHVLERALELSADERAELIVRLLDTIAEHSGPSTDGAAIEAAWTEEARRRLHEIKAGRVEPVPWSEARARIFAHELTPRRS
jgi:putative addiction module component (TIGR02574 family)